MDDLKEERAAFENWIGDSDRTATGYKTYTTEVAWRAWITRAALEKREGCYPGCFYYTDSCFRSDCKHRKTS